MAACVDDKGLPRLWSAAGRSQGICGWVCQTKKIKTNTQYNRQLSYHDHNKSMIVTSGGLLRAGAGALALGRRGGCGLPLAELPLPRWGGREVGDELPDAGLGTGGGPRAESRGSEAHWGGHEARGTGASRKQRESDSFVFWASLLDFVELGP